MKYRFRPSGKKRSLLISANTVLRLKGSDKPKKASNLPEAREKIDFSEVGGRSRFALALLSVKIALKQFWKGVVKKLRDFLKKSKSAASCALNRIPKKKKEKKVKSVNSLPLLAGAMTAAILVCAFSVIYMVFGLFSFYGRSYRTVAVPDTVGSHYSKLTNLGEDFIISVKSVNNPDFPDGTVISQSPPAGVTRRIYKDKGPCRITVTVSRSKKYTVPDGILGATERDALLALKNAGIPYKINREFSDSVPNSVTSIVPGSGTILSAGEAVTVTVSLGKQIDSVFMPDLTGLSESEAVEQISRLGLILGRVVYVESSQKAGTVTSQSIIKSTPVSPGTEISITVSIGRN
ncbi:MAG: PASTA domain-containing protein [Ruminococcaceae bacterium]|nr:PASTA domain-containing protein [Oscillospiraceae bacterium]